MDPGNLQDLIEASYRPNAAIPATLPNRIGFYNTSNSLGSKDTTVDVNQFRITSWPRIKFYQYDITVSCSQGSPADKQRETSRGDLRFLWNTQEVKDFRESISKFWLWDGNKIAWSDKPLPSPGEEFIRLDMDKIQDNRKPGKYGPTIKHWQIKQTTVVNFQDLEDYLSGKTQFSNSVLQCINVFDQIMRQTPTIQMNEVKRSWFPKKKQNERALNLASCYVEAQKGVYCSVRLCQGGPRTGVALNVDVANAVFWLPQPLLDAACRMWGRDKTGLNLNKYAEQLRPIESRDNEGKFIRDRVGNIQVEASAAWKDLRKLAGVMVEVNHKKREKPLLCSIAQFEFYKIDETAKDTPVEQRQAKGNYGQLGATAAVVRFDHTDKDTGKVTNMSVADYWKMKYQIDLSNDPFPLMRTRKSGLVPMQFCKIIENQRYKFKLDPEQTSDMIKFAVTKPVQRLEAIRRGIDMLSWKDDPVLNYLNVKIEEKQTKTKAVILQPPAIQFGLGGKEELKRPGTSGSWKMADTRLLKPCKPLNHWVLMIIDDCLTRDEWNAFFDRAMSQEAKRLGMSIAKEQRVLKANGQNLERQIDDHMAAFTKHDFAEKMHLFPQLFFIVVKDKNSHTYERIKSIMDTKYGVHSQVVQSLQLKKRDKVPLQYANNVLLKINAKLGGTTSRAVRLNRSTITGNGRARVHAQPDYLKSITADKVTKNKLVMVIGADVSHPGSLSSAPSFAALTVSMDTDLVRYSACIETNALAKETSGKDQKQGTEIIQQPTFEKMTSITDHWLRTIGNNPTFAASGNLQDATAPAHLFYMRDGVSEGQYQFVIKQEVQALRAALVKRCEKFKMTKITVIVASKRHHIRMLPGKADSCTDANMNPVPGLLVERDVTHPFENDFYLVSHKAIQGTARPIHYAVLLDEAKFRPDELIDWIYASCYQFVRSTTPVSIHPAIYYAHLASKRGAVHENLDFRKHGPRTGGEGHQHAIKDQYRKESAAAANKTLVAAGKKPEFDEEDRGKETKEPEKARGLGLYWRNPKVTPPERKGYFVEPYRNFAYGMWFI